MRGHDVTMSCHSGARVEGVKLDLHAKLPLLQRLGVAPSHFEALRRQRLTDDIVHSHSLWMLMNIAPGLIVPGAHAKLICSPHGTLSAWALSHSRGRKQLVWPLQRQVLARADLLHATADPEHDDIRANGFDAPVAVIANGIDLPQLPPRPDGHGRLLLFLSRIHPVKGIEALLEAWSRVAPDNPNWELMIAGPGEASYVAALADQASGLPRAKLIGPVYGAEKSALYRRADLFVLPSKSENFAMVVAEALGHECPVVVSKAAPWADVESEGCGWWTDAGPEPLAATLAAAMSLSVAERSVMGVRGRAWIEKDFSWASVAERLERAYDWILGRGDRPDFIKLP
nr:glycosyltransferase [Rhizorhabdus dicambivorans]